MFSKWRPALRAGQWLLLTALLCCALGCARFATTVPVIDDPPAERLARALADLVGPPASQTGMLPLARRAIDRAHELAHEYRVVYPPLFHNTLVNIHIKERGLCHHWASDLLASLKPLRPETLQLHWAVAYQGSRLREHHAIVFTARGKPFATGIVLDGWRHSGELFFAPVIRDHYPWVETGPPKP